MHSYQILKGSGCIFALLYDMDDGFWVEDGNTEIPSFPKKRKRKDGMRRFEFVGWGSKPLIEFLKATGQDTEKNYSRLEVVSFITKYINVKGLTVPGNKKKVICDEKLFAIFGKQMITRKKIHELLEGHFSENCDSSEDDSGDGSDEEESRGKTTSGFKYPKLPKAWKSCFAAVVSENIKLIYLKKSLVRELLKVPENFENKIVGSFVRMKSDPHDIYKKNEFQLQLVTGVQNFSVAVSLGTEIHLKVANFFKEVPLSMLSDDNFSEEEVEDVQQRIKAGVLKKFNISEFEMKARMLHVDITEHWIAKELSLLDKRIDHANEKGWRRELFEYLDRRKKLETPSEREKLIHNIPQVIAEELELGGAGASAVTRNAEAAVTSLKSVSIRGSDASDDEREAHPIPMEKSLGGGGGEANQKLAMGSADTGHEEMSERMTMHVRIPTETKIKAMNSIVTSWLEKPRNLSEIAAQKQSVCTDKPRNLSEKQLVNSVESALLEEPRNLITEAEKQVVNSVETDLLEEPRYMTQISAEIQVVNTEQTGSKTKGGVISGGKFDGSSSIQAETIDLSSDDEGPNDSEPTADADADADAVADAAIWHYLDPRGKTRGPFTLRALKRWKEANYFHSEFRVWETGRTASDGLLLTDVLRRSFR